MKKVIERLTNQKKIILEFLKGTKNHPTAEDVYLNVKKKLPRISRGTVYRILNNLKKKEEIIEISQKVLRYDGNTLPHIHFICEKCNQIYDVEEKCDFLKGKKIKVGKIKNYQIYLYGLCKKCQRK